MTDFVQNNKTSVGVTDRDGNTTVPEGDSPYTLSEGQPRNPPTKYDANLKSAK
jgi:hypothetical protein